MGEMTKEKKRRKERTNILIIGMLYKRPARFVQLLLRIRKKKTQRYLGEIQNNLFILRYGYKIFIHTL